MADEAAENIVDPRDAAESAGLVYVDHEMPGISRRKSGKGWSYRDPAGKVIKDRAVIERINKLAVPPAYEAVWICPDPDGHLQATGRDAKGRKQYRYHERFREVRDGTKYEHMLDFAQALPGIRSRIDADMRKKGLVRDKVLATVVHLLETTMIRVGNADYVKQNGSYGLTTLNEEHVEVAGSELKFRFKGKSGKQWNLKIRDRRVARIVKASQELPGQHLFHYLDHDGVQHEVTSGDVNAYLKDIAGAHVTAKDFRTWTGTVLAALALAEFEKVDSQAAAKKNVRAAIERVSARAGQHASGVPQMLCPPEVLDSYLSDALVLEIRGEVDRELADGKEDSGTTLRPEEAQVLAFLQKRLAEKIGI